MRGIPRVTILGRDDPQDLENRLGVVTFAVADLYHQLVAAIRSYEFGIAVRVVAERRWAGTYAQDVRTGEFRPEGFTFDLETCATFPA